MAADAAPVQSSRAIVIAPTVAMAAFMEVLDISIANVALQHIAGDMSASQDESTWILTSYLVTNAIVLPVSGWLSSVMGRKNFFLACIVGFTASSALCGLAPSLELLVFFRAVQGLTGGGLQPSAQAILTDAFPPAKRGMAFALYGMSVVFAPAIGPTLGGWITDTASWRWVFLINVPVGVILFFAVSAVVRDSPQLIAARKVKLAEGLRVDYIGFALLAIGLGFAQVVLDRGQEDDWFESAFILWLTIGSIAGLVAFVYWELRQSDPIVDLRLLGQRNFAISNVLMLFLGFILLGSTVLIPLMVQSLMGYTATEAGLVISPGGFAIIGMLPIVGRLVGIVDLRVLIACGLSITGVSLLYMTNLDLQTDYNTFMLVRIGQALGMAFLFIPINTAAFLGLPMAKSSNASAIINLSRNLGGSFGIALVATVLSRRAQVHQNFLVEHVAPGNPAYDTTIAHMQQVFAIHGSAAGKALAQAQTMLYGMLQAQANMLAFIDDFRLLGVLFILMIPVAFLMREGAAPRTGAAGGAH
ncbi:MAG TPA: DHA2 family efflux MFS transporter permease subunit [Candidatus Cybelea sp.]|nr:DHA2 family efflux MFS transporter permease subunit [Candidatus Cybelea sp.]